MALTKLTTLKPKYVTIEDLAEYIEGYTPSGDDPQILRRLARAERFVDLLGAGGPITQADPIQSIGIEFQEPPTAGSFKGQWEISGVDFTSAAIPYNATYAQVREAIATARSGAGSLIPQGPITFPGPPTPYIPSGPLPFTPVVVAFIGLLGGREVSTGTVVENTLSGGEAVVPKIVQICPGAPWGGRFNPSRLLLFNQLQALKNAVCAQYEYMLEQGDRFFVNAQYAKVRGPEFSTEGRLPRIAPQAREELSVAGLMTTTARSRP